MVSRAERLQHAETRTRLRLETERQRLAQIKAAQVAGERKARLKRRAEVGAMADYAGLCLWDDSTLLGLFSLLATLRHVPNPVAVLDACLGNGDNDAGAKEGQTYAPKYVSRGET